MSVHELGTCKENAAAQCESVCENQGRPQVCHVKIMLELLWTNSFVEDVKTISNPRSLTSVRIKDCILRVPNKTISLLLYEQP